MGRFVPFRLVDAFAEIAFTGNPAGVVLSADGLTDAQCQALAREVNASETAFIFGNNLHGPPRIRWWTPTVEVGFCGHATIGAAAALLEVFGTSILRDGAILFDSKAGVLRVRPEPIPARPDAFTWWLSMPDAGLTPEKSNPMRTCELLGLTMDDVEPAAPFMRTRDDDVIILVKSWQKLFSLQPNMFELAKWQEKQKIRGYCVSTRETLSESVHVASRFFAPAAGVPEDPVTGSVHGPLAVLLTVNDLVPSAGGKAALTCVQGEPGGRTGIIRALVETVERSYRVTIGGTCHVTVRGEIRVPSER